MRYVGTRASETNPLRSIPLLRPASHVLRWTPRQIAEFELSKARRAVPRAEEYLPIAYASLGRANATKGPMRRHYKAEAFRRINQARAELRRARKALVVAEAAMLALDGYLFGRA